LKGGRGLVKGGSGQKDNDSDQTLQPASQFIILLLMLNKQQTVKTKSNILHTFIYDLYYQLYIMNLEIIEWFVDIPNGYQD
jgi:hypothetical protein